MSDILVVDDSETARAIIGQCLRHPDRSIREAENGRKAMELVTEACPDMVITDLLMPDVDGLELVRELQKTHPTVPVILVTAHGSESIACQAIREGAASYVSKLRLKQDLRQVVTRVLAVTERTRSHQRLLNRLQKLDFTFEFGSDVSVVAPFVLHLQDTLSWMTTCTDAELSRVGIALDEALLNAIVHGNLEVCSGLREGGGNEYRDQIKERQHLPPYSERSIRVHASVAPDKAVITIEDDGPGFDHQALPDPTHPEYLSRASGRGVMLMRAFMDDVEYNAKGNSVTMTKRRST